MSVHAFGVPGALAALPAPGIRRAWPGDDFVTRLRAAAFDPRDPGPPPPVILTDDFNPVDAIVARQLWE